MNTQTARTNDSRLATRGFTLVEMLTVIAILAIVIAIVLPVMASSRTAAKRSETRVMLAGLGQACAAFQIDQRRLPGYFSPREMGDTQNVGRGFTTMDNILIDLVGGVTTQATNGTTIVAVGPMTTKTVNIDISAMGATSQNKTGAVSKTYLSMDPKRYVPQDGSTGARSSSVAEHSLLPALVDSFGTPVIGWMADDVPSAGAFAAMDATTPARFYRAQNAGFLDATALGKMKEDQRSDTNNGSKRGSALCVTGAPSGTPVSTLQCVNTMAALLGNASAPSTTVPVVPLSARAPIVFQSAGQDGVYVGLKDKGARSGVVNYAANQDPFGGILFDDMVGIAGN